MTDTPVNLCVLSLICLLAALPVQAQSPESQSAAECQVRVPQGDVLAAPLNELSTFGMITLSDTVRAVGDYPGQSSSTEVVRLDGEPWIVYRNGQKWVSAVNGAGPTWVPYIDGGLKVIGYYVKGDEWIGPYPAGSFNLLLQNKTEFRVGVLSQYGLSVPVRVWLTTRVC